MAPILLVEDNPADVRLAKEALREAGITDAVEVKTDGIEALAFLRREGTHAGAPRPSLIFLDLNMPRMDGREVLAAVKSDAELRSIPVIVLSTSQRHSDIQQAYAEHANSYISKPLDFDELVAAMSSVAKFWFHTAQLPAVAA